jgi:hypothetical protein
MKTAAGLLVLFFFISVAVQVFNDRPVHAGRVLKRNIMSKKTHKICLIIPIFLSRRWMLHHLDQIRVATKIPNQYPKVLSMFMLINLTRNFKKFMCFLVPEVIKIS